MEYFTFTTNYNRRLKGYEVLTQTNDREIQPYGGSKRDAEGVWPVSYVAKETNSSYTIQYAGTGHGDGPAKWMGYKTEDDAYKAGVRNIRYYKGKDVKILTVEESEADTKKVALRDTKKQLKDAKEQVQYLEAKLAELSF